MADSGSDRRKAPRKRIAVPPGLSLFVSDGDGSQRRVMGELVDVSEGGIGVMTHYRLKQGSIVRLEGRLRGPDYGLTLRGRARVAHTNSEPGGFRSGLQFVEVAYSRAASDAA